MTDYENVIENDGEEINRKGRRAYNILGIGCVEFLVLGMFVMPILLPNILIALFPGIADSFILGVPLTYAGMYLVAFPIMLLIVKRLPDHKSEVCPKKKLGVLTILAYYAFSYFIMTGIITVVSLIETHIIGNSGTTTAYDIVNSGTPQWVFLIAGCIIAPIMEEIIFRLIPYNKVSGYGTGLYIVWTGILFGLLHLNFGQALYAMGLGFFFAKVMRDTGNVKYTMLLHVMLNLSAGTGIGGYIIASENEMAMTIYTVYLNILMLIGLVAGIVMFVKSRKNKSTVQAENPDKVMTDKKRAFLNPGTLIYCVICIGFIIYMFF